MTLGSGGTIPQTFKTLKLVISGRSSFSNPSDDIVLQFNGVTTNYSNRTVYGDGSTASSSTFTSYYLGPCSAATATSSTFGNLELTIPNYASSTTNKPGSLDSVMENNATLSYQFLIANLWANNAAITSIALTLGSASNFVSGSTFTLYGLK